MGNDPNKARIARAQMAETFKALERHEVTLTELLEAPPAHMRNVDVHYLLKRSPKLDEKGAEKICRDARVWPLRPLKDLTPGDKQAIIAHLPPRVTELS